MRRMGMFGAVALLLTSWAAAPENASAQDGDWKADEAGVQAALWIAENEEMALALSAAPEAVAQQASVYVMGKWGYQEARVGDNGFTCYVDRGDDGQSVIPVCHDWAGSTTHFQVAKKREELRSQGKTSDEIQSAIAWGFMDGSLRAPRAGGLTYMLSTKGYHHNPEGENWPLRPQVMVTAPYAGPKTLGYADDEAGQAARWSGLPYVSWAGSPMTTIVIPVSPRADAQSSMKGDTGTR